MKLHTIKLAKDKSRLLLELEHFYWFDNDKLRLKHGYKMESTK